MVDAVVLRLAPGTEVERGLPDGTRSERPDVARAVRRHLRDYGRGGERTLVGVPALGADPALVRLQRRAVGDRLGGANSSLGFIDAEVGDGEQPGACCEDE